MDAEALIGNFSGATATIYLVLTGPKMSDTPRSKEQRILVVMRKVLASVVKDTAPPPGMRNPLSDSTIEDIRQCFGLIAAREQELAKEAGIDIKERPRYTDEVVVSKVVSIQGLKSNQPKED